MCDPGPSGEDLLVASPSVPPPIPHPPPPTQARAAIGVEPCSPFSHQLGELIVAVLSSEEQLWTSHFSGPVSLSTR